MHAAYGGDVRASMPQHDSIACMHLAWIARMHKAWMHVHACIHTVFHTATPGTVFHTAFIRQRQVPSGNAKFDLGATDAPGDAPSDGETSKTGPKIAKLAKTVDFGRISALKHV